MDYKLIITEAAEQQLDHLIYHLIFEFQSEKAASHLLDNVQRIYKRIEENPYQFPVYENPLLFQIEYRQAVFTEMNYKVLFRIDNECVYVIGIFHQLENYIIHLTEIL